MTAKFCIQTLVIPV